MSRGKMHMGLTRLATLALVILAAGVSPADEEVLYWMVDNTATISSGDADPVGLSSFLDPAEDFAARIRVTGGDIAEGEDRFLDIYLPGSGGMVPGEWGVDFDSGAATGYWGAGVPIGNQSPTAGYAGTPEFSFIVEIGNITGDSGWTTVATSAAVAYSSLGGHIGGRSELAPISATPWVVAEFHEVPEPSGGLLMLVGGALLALRRSKRGA